jgi:hypothetical protein
MGVCNCKCLAKGREADNEMINGSLPGIYKKSKKKNDINEIKNINTDENYIYNNKKEKKSNSFDSFEKDNDVSIKIKNKVGMSRNKQNNLQYNTSVLSMIQDLCDSIFDYLNEIRANPKDFEEEAQKYDLGDIIQKVKNSPIRSKNIIANQTFNSLLTSFVNEYVDDENENYEKLLEALDNEEKIKNYNKNLLVFDGEINNQKDAVWNLIEDNRNNAYDIFFSNDVEFFVISCQIIDDFKNFKCFLLVLLK